MVQEPGRNEYYLDEFVFVDDPLLAGEERSRLEDRGGSGGIEVVEDEEGVATGRRDIVLGRNIPHNE